MYYPRFEKTLEHSFGCLPETHFIWRLGCPVCSKSLLQCCSKLKNLKILQVRNSPKLWLGKRCSVQAPFHWLSWLPSLFFTEKDDLDDPGPASWVPVWQATCRCRRIGRMGGGNQRVCSGGQRMSRQTCGHLGCRVGWPRHVPTEYVIEFPTGTKTFPSSIQFQMSYF